MAPAAPLLSIKSLLPDQWPLLKSMRLRALTNAPEAFGMTLAEASARTDAEWQENARRFTRLPPAVSFLAYAEGQPCGMASCFATEADPRTAEMTAFWVAPEHRGQGVADALVTFVAGWASAQKFVALRATVVEDNYRAIAFYKKVGFQNTGQSEPFGGDASKRIILLAKMLESKESVGLKSCAVRRSA